MNHPTPYLRMDLDQVAKNYEQFRQVFPGIDIYYAMKCNPASEILQRLLSMQGLFEVASLAEITQLIDLGAHGADILFSNPVKMAAHIRGAREAGVYRFSFDSREELQKIAEQAPGASVYVRLATGDADSLVPSEGKFGVGGAVALELMLYARGLGLTPYGITFHVGSQMYQPEPWALAIQHSGKLMRELQQNDIRITMLDMGGGFPAPYQADDIDLAAFAATIQKATTEHLPYQPEKFALEPGRAIVAGAGVMVSQIIGTAERRGKHWIHLDVGAFNGMMEALETQNKLRFPMSDSRGADQKEHYVVTGPSCDSQDTILFDVELSAGLAAGDLVYIDSAGAYTTSYASNFNGFEIPKVYTA
jgi:ornithine decarboxylase